MHTEYLVTMANDIADFFHGAEPENAVRNVADHLRRFWDPRMRKAIIAFYAEGGAGLSDTARAAVGMLTGAPSVASTPPATQPPMEG
jgi:formate dehydrogenase subunit delta